VSLSARLASRLERELGRDHKGLLAILDFDGTLSPTVAAPGAARLAPAMRKRLAQLARSPRARVAVLSGRALGDLRRRVGLPGLVYGGCHGLEIAGAGLSFRHPRARRVHVAAARRLLSAGARAIPNARIEFKGLAVSFHYRDVQSGRRRAVYALVRRVARELPELLVVPGQRAYDFVPRVGWDKGSAVRWIARRVRPGRGRSVVLYVGDDVTDERAFAALAGRGLTVRVGGARTEADYAVRGVGEVAELLELAVRLVG
jgi:trehalose 6-phosphate phosphatase